MHTGIPEEKRPDYFDRLQELIGCGSLELIQEDGIMRCDSDSGKKLIKSMVLRTADRQGMC